MKDRVEAAVKSLFFRLNLSIHSIGEGDGVSVCRLPTADEVVENGHDAHVEAVDEVISLCEFMST